VQSGAVGNGPVGQVGVLPEFLTGVAVARRARRARVRVRGRVDEKIMVVVEDGLGTLRVERIVVLVGVYSSWGFHGSDEGRRWRCVLTLMA